MNFLEHNRAQWNIIGAYSNRETFGALLKSILSNLKSIIGPGLAGAIKIKRNFLVHNPTRDLQRRLGLLKQGVTTYLHCHLNDLNTEK